MKKAFGSGVCIGFKYLIHSEGFVICPNIYIYIYIQSRGMLIGFVLAAALALASATVLFCHPATSLRPYVHATHGFVSAARLL